MTRFKALFSVLAVVACCAFAAPITMEQVPDPTQLGDETDPFGLGAHFTLNGITYYVTNSPVITSSSEDTVARTSIDVLQTGKVSTADFYTLSTQRVTRVWSSDGTQFVETGVVWQASQVTNYTVALSADFATGPYRPSWANHAWGFTDGDWYSGGDNISAPLVIYYSVTAEWNAGAVGAYPVTIYPVQDASGTAVVSQHISTVYTYVKTYAAQSDVTAVRTDLTTHISTNAASVIAQAQPSVLVRYGDFATTGTVGYAAFGTVNPAQRYITTLQPITNQSLAKARYPIAAPMAGTLSLSAYASSSYATPAASNCSAYAVLSLFNAGGAVLASNIGATVEIARGAVSNVTASVAIPGTVSSGYIVAEIFSGTNAVNFVAAYAGGSYPMTLFATVSPLAYLTRSEADALYAMRDNGVQVNPSVAGVLDVQNAISLGGVTVTEFDAPKAVVGITNLTSAYTVTNQNESPVYLYMTGAVDLAFSSLRQIDPIYLRIKGPSTVFFPAAAHFVGGWSWQTNMVNHYLVWQTGTNLFINALTTSED